MYEELTGHIQFLSFTDPYEEVRIQYLLYNFEDILAAVGGAVGLFLGISVFGQCNKFLHWAESKRRVDDLEANLDDKVDIDDDEKAEKWRL